MFGTYLERRADAGEHQNSARNDAERKRCIGEGEQDKEQRPGRRQAPRIRWNIRVKLLFRPVDEPRETLDERRLAAAQRQAEQSREAGIRHDRRGIEGTPAMWAPIERRYRQPKHAAQRNAAARPVRSPGATAARARRSSDAAVSESLCPTAAACARKG